MQTLPLILLAIIFPPLAIAIKGGRKPRLLPFFINLALYLFAMAFAIAGHPLSKPCILLAIAHAIWIVCAAD